METHIFDYKLFIAILSLVFGIWHYWQKRKIKAMLALEAIELNKNIGQALSSIQKAKEDIQKNQMPSIEVGLAEGYTQAMLLGTAKLYCSMKNTTIEDIDKMIIHNQLSGEHKNIYYSFSNPNKGILKKFIKCIIKID